MNIFNILTFIKLDIVHILQHLHYIECTLHELLVYDIS